MSIAVVTGASTGIGRATARALSATFEVHAGVRNDEDAASVQADGLVPLRLDVTDPGSVVAAIAAARDAGDGRIGLLVNNAGIAVSNPLEALTDDDLARQFEVNVFGLHRVTREALPAIIAAKGRVVNLSSVAGRVGLPLMGAYGASKHAVEGYSDALRREVADFGVHVAVIEPGMVNTPIWDHSVPGEDALAALPERYHALARKVRNRALKGPEVGIAPEEVAAAIVHAATAERPRARYAMPLQDRIVARVLPLLPETIQDRLVMARINE